MEFSLKKARKLETKIGAFIAQSSSDFDFNFEARINDTVDNVEKQAVDARTTFLQNLKNLDDLNGIRYEIRRLISDANSSGGEASIDNLLNEKVQLESKISRLNSVLRFNKFDRNLMEDELNNSKKLLEQGTSRYGRSAATFEVNFLTSIDEQNFKDEKLKTSKRIEEIEDKLAELNYSKRISLGANSMKLLQDNGLL
jgi:hypothetical protein